MYPRRSPQAPATLFGKGSGGKFALGGRLTGRRDAGQSISGSPCWHALCEQLSSLLAIFRSGVGDVRPSAHDKYQDAGADSATAVERRPGEQINDP